MPKLKRSLSDHDLGEIAKTCTSRGKFKELDASAYTTARTRGILDKVCDHMQPVRKKGTEAISRAEALKYKTRAEFHLGCTGAYEHALRNQYLDSACEHMDIPGNYNNRCVYELREVKGNKVYVGITCNFNHRMATHKWRNRLGEGVTFEAVKLTEYIPVRQAQKIERQLILLNRSSKSHISVNKDRGGGLGGTWGGTGGKP